MQAAHIKEHQARTKDLYAAFLDPTALIARLPPAETTGRSTNATRGYGRISEPLFYPPDERAIRGKTTHTKDMVKVRFVELAPP